MIIGIGYFYDEYLDAEIKKKNAKEIIARIEQHNASVDAKAIIPPKAEKKVEKKIIIRERNIEEPTGGSPPPPELPKVTPAEAVKSVPSAPIERESKIEIDAGLVKVAMSNEASWNAILKIMFTILGTFFGVKLINLVFKKLDPEPKPA